MNVSARRAWLTLGLAIALTGPATAATQATGYPTKPIRLIVPLAPAGSTDIVARIVGQKFNEAWGQPVIVDNRPGGGTTIGSALVARAPADGYTLLFASVSLATSVPLYRSLPYDPVKDFAPIGTVGQSFYVLAVHPSVPVHSMQELVALAKAKPGQVSYASAGSGTITHLTVELFISQVKIDVLHVPFKGGAPALVALLGGQVQMIFNPIAEILPHVKAGGKVRTLAVTSPQAGARPAERADPRRVRSAGFFGHPALGDLRAGRHAARDRRSTQRRVKSHVAAGGRARTPPEQRIGPCRQHARRAWRIPEIRNCALVESGERSGYQAGMT